MTEQIQLTGFDQWLQTQLFGPGRLSKFMSLAFTAAAGFGILMATSLLRRFGAFVFRHTLRRGFDLQAKYGSKTQKSWAVVTGGSDGYGLDICQKLAKKGFNICMISRNEAKMQEKLAEIAHLVETKYIVANFFEMTKIADYERIATELKSLDVALLFLNAGVIQLGPFSEIPNYRVQAVMNINAIHPMYMSKVMVNQMLARPERSAIVVTSSGLGVRPFAGVATYSAAKACSSFMAQALNYELKDKIDVMSWESGAAGTKFFPEEQRAKMVPLGKAVDGMLRDLGHESVTSGTLPHDWAVGFLKFAPFTTVQKMLYIAFTNTYRKEIEEISQGHQSLDEYIKR